MVTSFIVLIITTYSFNYPYIPAFNVVTLLLPHPNYSDARGGGGASRGGGGQHRRGRSHGSRPSNYILGINSYFQRARKGN